MAESFCGGYQQPPPMDTSMWIPGGSSNQTNNFHPIDLQNTHHVELSSSTEEFLWKLCAPDPDNQIDAPISVVSDPNPSPCIENSQVPPASLQLGELPSSLAPKSRNQPGNKENILSWNQIYVHDTQSDADMQAQLPSSSLNPEPTATPNNQLTNAHTNQPSQLTSAKGQKSQIEVLNPKFAYKKIQKKMGPGGKNSQQRISRGQVKLLVTSVAPLQNITIYVQRTEEALKKLLKKGTVNSQAYSLPPVPFPASEVKFTPQHTNVALGPPVCAILCELDLDSVYKYPEEPSGFEVYKLERTKIETYNKFCLSVQIEYQDNSQEWLIPYDFVVMSDRTQAGQSSGVAARHSHQQNNGRQPLVTCYLEAETAKITNLEVESWQTVQHDIAYSFIKVKKEETQRFEEGDVVGFFVCNEGRTYIDFLTEENSYNANLAGVISRHAFIKGNSALERETGKETDLVCIIGQIKIKVSGKVKNGDLIYASNCDRYPGTAVSQNQLCSEGNRCHTLLGYALESSNEVNVSLVDCLVSIVLGITTKDQKRALRDLVKHVESNVESVRSQMNKIDDRFNTIRKNRKVMIKKAIGLLSFLLFAGIVCYIFLAPNSPYIKSICEKGRLKTKGKLSYMFHPKDTEEESQRITGIEFRWRKLKAKLKLRYKKMNGTNNRYFLNMNRCLTGGVRRVARWLDPSPKILPINVLAVHANCSRVYFYSRDEKDWKPFDSARVSRISCSPNT